MAISGSSSMIMIIGGHLAGNLHRSLIEQCAANSLLGDAEDFGGLSYG
jgi:hypothetical protein